MARKKKVFRDVEVIDMGEKGYAVGRRTDGEIVMVFNGAPGEIVDVQGRKRKKSLWWGDIINRHAESKSRIEPFCEHFEDCGGCQWQYISYQDQLYYKEKKVRDAMARIAKTEVSNFLPILGAPKDRYYRNKMEFSCTSKRWITKAEMEDQLEINNQGGIGLFRAGNFQRATDIHHCYLQGAPSNEIRNFIRSFSFQNGIEFYDNRAHIGLLRDVMIRISRQNECMVVISFAKNDQERISLLLDALKGQFKSITSLYYTINTKVNNFIYDLDMIHYAGNEQMEEHLGHLKFKIRPKSFFQTNSEQAYNLYEEVRLFADFQGGENLYDLYCGTGSIGLFLARDCKKVVGVEEVEQAVLDARENAEMNHIDNALFHLGRVRDVLDESFQQVHGKPDLIITDPPRAGMHPNVIDILLQLDAPKIIYVSCNPATQARDISMLKGRYRIEKLRAVDMFPQTAHIESVALMVRKD